MQEHISMGLIKRFNNQEETKKSTRYYSSKQEKKVAKELGAKITPNSGATMFQKGDLILDNWLLECKTQTKSKESFTIKKEWFEKNLRESVMMGKDYTAVVFNFGPDQENYYVIDEKTFQELLQLQQNNVV